jgi:hypothetical protein
MVDKELEDKNLFLSENTHYHQLYIGFVKSNVVSSDEFQSYRLTMCHRLSSFNKMLKMLPNEMLYLLVKHGKLILCSFIQLIAIKTGYVILHSIAGTITVPAFE